jgi:hypothetical protein
VIGGEVLGMVAVMVAMPPATAVARPLLSILAARVLDEIQMTCAVISWLVPSEYSPKAVNCWVNCTWIFGLTGVTSTEDTEDRVAEVTVRVVLPEIPPEVAVMVAVPAATAVARPLLSTVTNDVLNELQMTCPVISRLVPSEYAPEAASCVASP